MVLHNLHKGVTQYTSTKDIFIDYLEMEDNTKYGRAAAEMDFCLGACL